jgi:SAM-dependent methyltransferase
MPEMARRRGIRVRHGCGEELPYANGVFDGVLMVVTVCFLSDPGKAFAECARVLKGNGGLVMGLVPADSPWGEFYAQRGREGHPFYAAARFYTSHRVLELGQAAGFLFDHAVSCLFSPPRAPVDGGRQDGIVPGAGFVGLRFQKTPNG